MTSKVNKFRIITKFNQITSNIQKCLLSSIHSNKLQTKHEIHMISANMLVHNYTHSGLSLITPNLHNNLNKRPFSTS